MRSSGFSDGYPNRNVNARGRVTLSGDEISLADEKRFFKLSGTRGVPRKEVLRELRAKK